MATVRAENLYKVFGPRPDAAVRKLRDGATRDDLLAEGVTSAVMDASFEAKEGETFVVMGLSGSGKSTLIRMLNGILPASAGSVYVDDSDVTQLSGKDLRALRSERMSMVFQHFALFPHRTVLDNAAYGLEVRGEDKSGRREKAIESLETVGLKGWGNSYPSQLSGGMKQRVGLARALTTDTDVMLMDEAFSALDPLIRREMQDQLIELQKRLHKTIVFITHDLNEAMKLGDRIAMMRDGKIVQTGTPEEFLNQPADDYVASFIEDVDRSRVLTANVVMHDPVTVRSNATLAEAQQVLGRRGLSGLHIVDRRGQLLGGITATQLTDLAHSGSDRTCGEFASEHIVTATPETTVFELFGPVGRSALPLAVVDDQNTLLGMISQSALLAAASNNSGSTATENGESVGQGALK